MYRIIMTLVIVSATSWLSGCKEKPAYFSQANGEKTVELLDALATKVETYNTDTNTRVNNQDTRIAALETRSGIPVSGSAGVTYVLNPNTPPSLTSTDTRPFTVLPTPAGANLASTGLAVTSGTPVLPLGFIQLPPCDLAVKFGEFKNGTELHLATLNDSQTKQDEKLTGHDTAIGELITSVGELTEKVNGFNAGLDKLKLEVQGLKTTPPPTPEAQPKPPS